MSPRLPPSPATGGASWRMAPPGMVRYQLAIGEVSSGAVPLRRTLPIYPPGQLAACLAPVDVQARLVVDRQGKVGEARVADAGHANATRRLFIAAVRAAAKQWQFIPLQVSRWAADADGNSHLVDTQSEPFSRVYVFHFECHAGQPAVTADAVSSKY